MHNVLTIFRREFASYFATPLASVFIIIFLVLVGVFAFFIGNFYARGQADLTPFFFYHPWLYLFLIPALSMRLWAEERNSGSIEFLMTLPISTWEAALGKFFAAWVFAGLALALTFPMWMTVNYLGDPDNGAILTAYIGSFLTAGGLLSIGACLSAATRNQVIAFILTAVVCFLFLLSGASFVLGVLQGWAPQALIDAVASLSFLTHFNSIMRGVIDLRDLVYFATLIAAWLTANVIVLEMKKAD
jgi:ABC-2 type transport system permease protein